MRDITSLLSSLEPDDPAAAAELLPLVYDYLRRLAMYRLAHEARGQTLEPTAAVHEARPRLVADKAAPSCDGRGQFFAAMLGCNTTRNGARLGTLMRRGASERE
jgi:hypothetical protein